MVLQNAWTPPITAETLQELCMDQITSNIQLRHDLLFDRNLRFRPNFDGPSGKAKQRKAERYWARLDRAFQHHHKYASDYDAFLPVLLDQVVESLALLRHLEKWPRHITIDTVRSMLNPDVILRELANNTLDLRGRVQFVISVLQPMCPVEHRPRIQLFFLYFIQKCYAKAFRQCFAIIEAIQLNSRAGPDQRSIEVWLASSRDHPDWNFLKVYHTALVRLTTMDHIPFPNTLQYDRQRLVHQFRAEFIYITTLAILLIPYYYLVGKWWNKTDLHALKLKLTQRLKRAGIAAAANPHQQQHHNSQYQYYAIYACEAAMATHASDKKKHTSQQHYLQLEKPCTVLWWADWLKRHMNGSSEIYNIMHDRVFHVVKRVSQGQLQQHDLNSNTLKPLNREILALGLRIRAVADLNLATYGTLYQQVWHKMTNSFKF
ncbi:hypothetical protein BDB00DRAFT_784771 [Zychaea mexicana]|uniref:uncharacterized protein n=1 Tax=Zychaea mexicana TaxID=64656 RepID=UPI0022FEC0E9|nr:uncharacterized protein BDB00DRAFT_784771 [Zychaea mexicana]KAI9497436.1 hypothetical protein BDB00DRAFT_784771 [Zychaea mexicana]